ncbi:MAG: GntR family transcriptional regulator [Nitrosomonadaceae bacterium]
MAYTHANPLAEQVYGRLKEDIFEFRLLPGDHFTETEMAAHYEVSRTPMRDALYRLQREGFLEVGFRRGWKVRNLDFAYFDDLYDLRIVLEIAAIERICQMTTRSKQLLDLKDIWLAPKNEREKDGRVIARLDESFHMTLVSAAANKEVARVHAELTEKIRIIRRLDFTDGDRIEATYQEHAKILQLLLQRKFVEVSMQLRSHIEQSKLEVRKITLHRLHEAQDMNCPIRSMVKHIR